MLGKYTYDESVYEFSNLVTINLVPLDNGAFYQGQWNKNGKREGKGV